MYEGGIENMNYSVSDTAEWGEYVSGPRVVTAESKAAMKDVLTDIQNGTFAREWIQENETNRPQYTAKKQAVKDHQIEQVGAKLREMMPFVGQKASAEVVGK